MATKEAARDEVVRAACVFVLSGNPRAMQTADLVRAVDALVTAHRPPGLLCVRCDGDFGEHAADCPVQVLTSRSGR